VSRGNGTKYAATGAGLVPCASVETLWRRLGDDAGNVSPRFLFGVGAELVTIPSGRTVGGNLRELRVGILHVCEPFPFV